MLFAQNPSTDDNRFVRSKISNNRHTIKSVNHTSDIPGYLGLYLTPPGEDISLLEFDEIAMERLKMLKNFENCKDSHPIYSKEFENKFYAATKDAKLIVIPNHAPLDPTTVTEYWRRDLIGHFILRLAFCRTPENQKWLSQTEGELLRFRLRKEREQVVDNAISALNSSIHRLTEKEKQEFPDELYLSAVMSSVDFSTKPFYRVDMCDATELIRRGKILMKHGYFYFPFEDLVNILVSKMKVSMQAAMARAFKHLAILEEEGRILPHLSLLANNAYSGKDYNGEADDGQMIITRHMIDKLMPKSFPPCMKQMHRHLRTNHHLKYGARRQYGLFLKGIGLSLDEAMAMMRDEFTKKIPSDKFDKEYGYNIRYMYGKEGRRVPQTAMSCASIILRNPPSAVDCHGCPFKHCEPIVLKQKLGSHLKGDQIEKISQLCENSQYDKACTRYFEFTHNLEEGGLGQLITHPNQYYEESQKIVAQRIAAKKIAKEEGSVKVEKMETD